MKVLGGCAGIADLYVICSTQLQKPFEARAGMFRAKTFKTMGQHQHQTAQALPFGLPAGDKQVNNGLGIIDKVAELGFPDGQCLRCRRGVAILEAEYRFLDAWSGAAFADDSPSPAVNGQFASDAVPIAPARRAPRLPSWVERHRLTRDGCSRHRQH